MNMQTMTTMNTAIPQKVGDLPKKGRLFVLAASSGVGKTTLLHALCDIFKNQRTPLVRVITYTTRSPRKGEVNDADYHFISEVEFQQKIQDSFFLEWSSAYGAYYGSPRFIERLLQEGVFSIIVLDRDGIRQLQPQMGELLVPIWLYTDRATQRDLLNNRGTEQDEQKQLRISLAQREEIAEKAEPLCRFHIKNNSIDEALGSLIALITKEMESLLR